VLGAVLAWRVALDPGLAVKGPLRMVTVTAAGEGEGRGDGNLGLESHGRTLTRKW
jgi:hypothetical protein